MRSLIFHPHSQKLKLVEFDAGEVITREGERGNMAYWLLSGVLLARGLSCSHPGFMHPLHVCQRSPWPAL